MRLLTKSPPELRMRTIRVGEKPNPFVDDSVTVDGALVEIFLIRAIAGPSTLVEAFRSQHQAFGKAAELFDEYGGSLEVEIHLNALKPPESILYDSGWIQKWNRCGRAPVPGADL